MYNAPDYDDNLAFEQFTWLDFVSYCSTQLKGTHKVVSCTGLTPRDYYVVIDDLMVFTAGGTIKCINPKNHIYTDIITLFKDISLSRMKTIVSSLYNG